MKTKSYRESKEIGIVACLYGAQLVQLVSFPGGNFSGGFIAWIARVSFLSRGNGGYHFASKNWRRKEGLLSPSGSSVSTGLGALRIQ
jgi:hypothetical protein